MQLSANLIYYPLPGLRTIRQATIQARIFGGDIRKQYIFHFRILLGNEIAPEYIVYAEGIDHEKLYPQIFHTTYPAPT